MSDYHHILVNHPDAVVRVDIHGGIGARGKSAYQSYVDTTTDDPLLTEEEWSSASATPEWDAIANKPATFPPSAHTHTFASLTSKPTTLDGYGITDAMPAPLELTAPPENGTANFLETSFTGENNDLRFEQVGGVTPTITFVYTLSFTYVDVSGPDIIVHVFLDGGVTVLDTAADIKALVEDQASHLVSVTYPAGNDGTGLLPSPATQSIEFGPTALSGALPGTVASQLGQSAIATIDGTRIYSFRCVDLSPMTWEGATPGLLFNATLGEWRIATLTGADGSESITYGPL